MGEIQSNVKVISKTNKIWTKMNKFFKTMGEITEKIYCCDRGENDNYSKYSNSSLK